MIRHPSLSLLSTPFSREDLFLVVYCLVDDWMYTRFGSPNAPRARRGPGEGEFSDAEVLTVLLVGELCHCRRESANATIGIINTVDGTTLDLHSNVCAFSVVSDRRDLGVVYLAHAWRHQADPAILRPALRYPAARGAGR